MKRYILLLCLAAAACEKPAPPTAPKEAKKPMEKITKTDDEWRKLLTPEQFRVARQQGTEQAFTGAYWKTKTDGEYHCVCCDLPLFDNRQKFDSGCGWPSFWDAVIADNVTERPDDSHGMHRVEVVCTRCGAHLGHVFDDGPKPTGKRFCINSASVKLIERKKKDKE